jgi:hypothetical protein
VDRHLTVTVSPAGRRLLAGAACVYGVRDLQSSLARVASGRLLGRAKTGSRVTSGAGASRGPGGRDTCGLGLEASRCAGRDTAATALAGPALSAK